MNLLKTCLLAAVAAIVAPAEALPVSIHLDKPEMNVSKKRSGASKSSMKKNKKTKEKITRSYDYSGKISTPRADKPATVTLEAFFVTYGVGDDNSKEKVRSSTTVGNYDFGPDRPRQFEFSFSSPKYKVTETTEKSSSRGNMHVDRSSEGKALRCMILRAVEDGQIRCVVTDPANAKWKRAALDTSFPNNNK